MADGKLLSGQSLRPEDTLVSVGGHARLHYQGDGNLVVYLDGTPFWASHTDGHSAGLLQMRRDGNLVITDAAGQGIASTNTSGHPGAMVQLQDDGNFVIYEDPLGPLAGTPIWASSTGAFTVGAVPPEAGGSAPTTPLVGKVEYIDGGRKGVRDATGQRNIVGLHAGDLLSEAFNHGWGKVTKALDYAQSRGFHFVRSWTNLPAPDWWGVPPRPGTFSIKNPEHEGIVRQFARELVARNLRWLVSQGDLMWLWPGDKARLCGYMGWLGRVLQQEGGADRLVIGVDAGNEAWNFTRCTDPVLMGAMLDAFLRECPCAIRSMTSAIDEGTLNQFDGPPVTLTDKHGSRDTWRMAMERSFTVGYWDGKTHPYTIDSEGPGCGPKVSATNQPAVWMEPEVMGSIALVALLARQIPVVMSSPGVYLDTETFEQYDAQLSLAPKIAALLPADVQSWRFFHGGENRPFSPDRIFAVSDDEMRSETGRASDGRAWSLIYLNEPGHRDLVAINGFEGEVIHPGTLERSPIRFTKGQRVRFDMQRCRCLLGRVL